MSQQPDFSYNPIGFDFMKFWLRVYLEFIGLEMHGTENIPVSGGAIIASNHISGLDPFAVGQATRRRVHFMAKKELFATWFGNFLYRSGNAFPVDRHKSDLGAIKTSLRLLQAGQLLVIFPQGTRGGQENKNGAAFFAIKGKVPVVPAGIAMKRNWFGGKRYVIRYGPAIAPSGATDTLSEQIVLAMEGLAKESQQ